MSIFAEACLSVVVESLAQGFLNLCRDHLCSRAKHNRLAHDIAGWSTMLLDLRAVLHDAENKQTTSLSVRNWLADLYHLLYDAEDILDDFNSRLSHHSTRSITTRITRHFSGITFDDSLISKLNTVTSKLYQLTQAKHTLNLLEAESSRREPPGRSRRYTTSLMVEEVVYGREAEKQRLVDLLLNQRADETLGVIPIVGMAGMGKTTLARYAFHDGAIVAAFDRRVWICVTNDFSMLRVTTAILEAVTERACTFTELSLIQSILKNALSRNKILLVLDDVWNITYQDWLCLKAPLVGTTGSKVIVTTRFDGVATLMKTEEYEPLKPMSDGDCWKLLCRHADLDPDGDSGLEIIGRNIAEKCRGLPLKVLAVAGCLRYKDSDEEWEEVLRSNLLGEVGVMSTLRLSYYELPSHLKRCFVFCATFPEDHEFKENDMVLIWLGVGLIQWEGTRQIMEEDGEINPYGVGHKYFRELVSRFIFIPSTSQSTYFVMHDLYRRVAMEFSANACCAMENLSQQTNQFPSHWIRTRHLSFKGESLKAIAREINARPPPLRSFIPVQGRMQCGELRNDLNALISNLKHLRLLSLRRSIVSKLPESIGRLTHLRYLDLSESCHTTNCNHALLLNSIVLLYRLEILILTGCSYVSALPNVGNLSSLKYLNAAFTNIRTLPESISSLHSLEYLILSNCTLLEDLPSGIGDLSQLRHLDISSTNIRTLPPTTARLQSLILRACCALQHLPPDIGDLTELRHLDVSSCRILQTGESPLGISKLRNLRYLSDFFVGRNNIGALGNLNYLRDNLRISGISNIATRMDAASAKLWDKRLDGLTLEWNIRYGVNIVEGDDAEGEENVLEELRPHRRLKKLTLRGYCGRSLPSWIARIGLKELEVHHCPNLSFDTLPAGVELLGTS